MLLSTGEARIRSGMRALTDPWVNDLPEDFTTYESRMAWAHAMDLGIFVGDSSLHYRNPVIVAMCGTRNGVSVYSQLAQAEAAWEYFTKHQNKDQKQVNNDPRG
ncbi:hypothetical protein H0W91_02640 [Patescibacteria group bacterium]|nr:hypothetical protein [Patescibacteria group bacterium]